jgi:hypothetical protein
MGKLIQMRNKNKYHSVRNNSKIQSKKCRNRRQNRYPNTQIHDNSLSRHGTDTMKVVGSNKFYGSKPPFLAK